MRGYVGAVAIPHMTVLMARCPSPFHGNWTRLRAIGHRISGCGDRLLVIRSQSRLQFCNDVEQQAQCKRISDVALHHAVAHDLILKLLVVVHNAPRN